MFSLRGSLTRASIVVLNAFKLHRVIPVLQTIEAGVTPNRCQAGGLLVTGGDVMAVPGAGAPL